MVKLKWLVAPKLERLNNLVWDRVMYLELYILKQVLISSIAIIIDI